LNCKQTENLFKLCEFPLNQKWSLIYRASQDGFEAENFHSKCDNKPNTLVIIKSINGNVFGGYTEQSWLSTNNWKDDPNSFIFSLVNQDYIPLKMKWSKGFGIYCNKNNGPAFGFGTDLKIANRSNINTYSYSYLGSSYVHPIYDKGSDKAKSFLAGSYNFQVSEIEVYIK
jgi:hypothetical protein